MPLKSIFKSQAISYYPLKNKKLSQTILKFYSNFTFLFLKFFTYLSNFFKKSNFHQMEKVKKTFQLAILECKKSIKKELTK